MGTSASSGSLRLPRGAAAPRLDSSNLDCAGRHTCSAYLASARRSRSSQVSCAGQHRLPACDACGCCH
eukprot:11376353-Alexandrium_andersonii.AAC.1